MTPRTTDPVLTLPVDGGLIERLCAATGPDRELDSEIGCIARSDWPNTTAKPAGNGLITDAASTYVSRKYTSSIDAALTLVPEGWGWSVCHYAGCPAHAFLYPPEGKIVANEANTAALALCIAALKARQSFRTRSAA